APATRGRAAVVHSFEMRGAVLLLLLAGCSSETPLAQLDLAVGPPTCTFMLSGDVSGTIICNPEFCRAPTGDLLQIHGSLPPDPLVNFGVDGPFVQGRSYTAADLSSFNAFANKGFEEVTYVAGNQVPGSTVTLTITDVEWNANDLCPTEGNVHGTA